MSDAVTARLGAASLVCWDFDGVIKESVRIKTDAFHALFLPHGAAVAERVKAHHLAHGGMSRFKKMPLYLEWAGLEPSPELSDQYCAAFARAVEDAVVASDWVPGVLAVLRAPGSGRRYVLVTATPQEEIESIIDRLDIRDCFSLVFGAPTGKAAGIRAALAEFTLPAADAVMIGDSQEDLRAAEECGVRFILRRTAENAGLMSDYNGASIVNFE